MAFPLLPSLVADPKVAIPQSGEWTKPNAQNTLTGLVDSLKVAANKYSNISSIPDVWAHPILMRSILSDDQHPQYGRYVAEWRGLLAIMALRKMRGLSKLQVVSIEIPTADKLQDDAPEFLKVLVRSIPLEYLQMQNDGTIKDKPGIQAKIQLLTYDNHPLGIFWPSILICPALGLEKYQPHDIAWWGNDGLMDPISSLSNDEKNSLHAWLQNVINSISDNNNALMKLLTAFRDDLKQSLAVDFKDTAFQGQAGKGLGVTGACAIIDIPIEGIVDDTFLEKSQVLLTNRRGNDSLPNLLIVTPDLDQQWNVSASQIIVGGYLNASTCLNKGTGLILDHFHVGDVDLSDYHAEIHMANEFFTDKVTIFYLPYNAFPTVMENKVYPYGQASVNIILPIRKWLLDYLEPEFIAKNTKIAVINQDIEVTLSLPVSGPDGKGKMLVTKKIYKAAQPKANNLNNDEKKEILDYDSVPLIQVWPNIRMREPNAWKAYYTYFDLGDSTIPFHASPLFKQETPQSMKLPDNTSAEICKGTSFPEAFVCENRFKDLYGKEVSEEIGLLLLDQNKVQEVSAHNVNCKIGIDFGTTNTTAYMYVDNEQPHLIQFKNHKYYVTLTADGESITGYDRNSVRKNFISEQEQPGSNQGSIKTMYHANPQSQKADPFFSGNIYYLDQSKNIDADRSIMGNVKTTEMKWDKVNGRIYMQGFLMQFCLQCMVEAVIAGASTLEWLYSYPKAFSITQRQQYKMTWHTIYTETISTACTLHSSESGSLSESESVAEYFKKDMQASTARGIICMDIGGGTTDIAIWQGSKDALLNQTSIRFAGRNILNDYLWNRKQNGHLMLSKLKNGNSEFINMLDSLENEESKHGFDLKLEALLRDYEADIFSSLPTKSADTEIALLIRDITFALAGIFFYSGMLVGHLLKAGKYDMTKLLPNCYVGGNASKLLNWAADGEFSSDSLIAAVFKECMYRGILYEEKQENVDDDFDIYMTDYPKQEVAYGLVTSTRASGNKIKINLSGNTNDVCLLAGEKFAVDATEQPSEIVSAEDFLAGVHIDNKKPEVFDQFVSLFNNIMQNIEWSPVVFEKGDFINICTNVNQDLSDMKQASGGNTKNINTEPIFILVLKEAYQYLSKK